MSEKAATTTGTSAIASSVASSITHTAAHTATNAANTTQSVVVASPSATVAAAASAAASKSSKQVNTKNKEGHDNMRFIKDLISGVAGGVAQTAAGHPLDTVKVRLQTQVHVPGQPPQFSGMVDCFKKTIGNEGFRALYKGAASPLLGSMAVNGVLFSAFGEAESHLRKGQPEGELSLNRTFIAGGIAGAAATLVECPADVVKVKLQAQVGSGAYRGVFDAARKIASSYGVRGLYQGVSAHLVRNVPAFALYFWSYEGTRRYLTKPGEVASLSSCFIAGAVSGFGFWGTIYPTEMIKTRMQNDALEPAKRAYKGWWDCATRTYKDQGMKGLFRGYIPCNVRAVPVNGVVFVTVTALKRKMDGEL